MISTSKDTRPARGKFGRFRPSGSKHAFYAAEIFQSLKTERRMIKHLVRERSRSATRAFPPRLRAIAVAERRSGSLPRLCTCPLSRSEITTPRGSFYPPFDSSASELTVSAGTENITITFHYSLLLIFHLSLSLTHTLSLRPCLSILHFLSAFLPPSHGIFLFGQSRPAISRRIPHLHTHPTGIR